MSNFSEIRAFAEDCLSDLRGSHDWGHTCRVHRLSMRIGRVEGADLEVVEIAAYLHDVGRVLEVSSRGLVCHAAVGAEVASSLLAEYGVREEKKANIVHCIRSHRFRGNGGPKTLEARVLFDADKLDAIGAIGIGRAFQFAGELGAKFHNPDLAPEETLPYSEEDTGHREFKLKLCRIKDRMLTKEGARLAGERHVFMEKFFERFFDECDGIR